MKLFTLAQIAYQSRIYHQVCLNVLLLLNIAVHLQCLLDMKTSRRTSLMLKIQYHLILSAMMTIYSYQLSTSWKADQWIHGSVKVPVAIL